MALYVGSRYSACQGIRDESGKLYLTEREPYRYQDFPDNRVHKVTQGDNLFILAGRYFAPLPRACGFFWVIADFQPQPIIDPTLSLNLGMKIFVPSLRILQNVILGASNKRGSL